MIYEWCSSQTINKNKSAIFFNPNTDEDTKNSIMTILNISNVAMNEKYLGLPTIVRRNKNDTFKSLKERV